MGSKCDLRLSPVNFWIHHFMEKIDFRINRLHGFKYMNFQIFHGEELAESPPHTPSCIQSRVLPSIWGLTFNFLAFRALRLYVFRFGHRPRFPPHVYLPSPHRQQRKLDEMLFSSNINFLATVNAGSDSGSLPLPCFIFQIQAISRFQIFNIDFFMNVANEHGLNPYMLLCISNFASTMCQNKWFRTRFSKFSKQISGEGLTELHTQTLTRFSWALPSVLRRMLRPWFSVASRPRFGLPSQLLILLKNFVWNPKNSWIRPWLNGYSLKFLPTRYTLAWLARFLFKMR